MPDFIRPKEGFRFLFGGMKVNVRPDALTPEKFAIAINVREYETGTLRCRPGLTQLFTLSSGNYAFNIRAYSVLGMDNFPRILAYTGSGAVFLDNNANVGTLALGAVPGASMIPFRPNQSPNPYMYIANGADYQKFSAPDGSNVVTQQKVGIAEPPVAPDAYLGGNSLQGNAPFTFFGFASTTHGGTAGAITQSNRITDTTGTVLSISVSGGVARLSSVQVGSSVFYQRLMFLEVNSGPFQIQDVFPPLPTQLAISSILYPFGAPGECIIVVKNLGGAKGISESIYTQNIMSSLGRGAMIKIGTEFAMVLNVTEGPDGTVAIETNTALTHTTADAFVSVPSFTTSEVVAPASGGAVTALDFTSAVTAGIGTLTFNVGGNTNPFINQAAMAQEDDYITFGIQIDNLSNLNEVKFLIDVGDGSFTKDFYYYAIRPSDIQQAIANSSTQLAVAQTVDQRATIDEELTAAARNALSSSSGTQLLPGSGVWSQIVIPIRALTRVGSDNTKSLQTMNAWQFLFNANGTINVAVDAPAVFSYGQPDVGDIGAPYRYRVRPRSKVTGVIGNPSPATRYGVSPRRRYVFLVLPSAAYDPQIDTWDIERYGGAVAEWRFIGSTPVTNSTFQDNFGDDAAQAGDALEFDNFEPWPSVDFPFSAIASKVTGTAALVSVNPPTNILRFLPGNLVQIGTQNVYTLRTRPTLVTGTTYLFQFEENAGAGTNLPVNIYEPEIARQFLPFMWGPDANGTIFACGDPLRPGTLYFSKPYMPDSAPDSYNQEITPPTEPLLGGEIIDGVSFIGSTERWWRLYFQPDNPAQRFSAVQEPFTRGIGAPFGHCNDGRNLYYWAKDGIYRNDQSLTDEDLYPLFPHEGVAGQDVTYNGVTIKAPAYQQALTFRLTYSNNYLYAIYQDSSGVFHCLTADLRGGRVAWCYDVYNAPPTCAYRVEQQEESFATPNPVLLFGQFAGFGVTGVVCKQSDLTNDNGASFPISCTVASFEFDGGDVRAPKQWGDLFLDLLPAAPAGVSATLMSMGTGVIPPIVITSSTLRARLPVSVGGTITSDFMGVFLQWVDDFSVQLISTQIFVWQPSFDIQPAKTIGWKTFGTSFGLQGYGHIRQIALAWISTQPITLTITTVDGQAPQVLTIPSSGGAYKKQLFPLTANKGQLFIFQAQSTAPFQIFEDDIEIHVGGWSRTGPYQIAKSFGGRPDASAPI